jgi:YD repeat-containing protein
VTTTVHEAPTDGSFPAWTEVTNAKNHKTTTYWNRRGQAKRVVDPNLNETTTTYDNFGRVRSPRRAAQGVTWGTDPW